MISYRNGLDRLRQRLEGRWSCFRYVSGCSGARYKAIELDEAEIKLFGLLNRVKSRSDIRIAGGWVRDKLLGKNCEDVDIALEDETGAVFSEALLAEYNRLEGSSAQAVTLAARPDQSKHLETTMFTLYGKSIDAVHLRKETYTENSRVPAAVLFGTPQEDSNRRDFTINALFYNLRSEQVEDFTGRGLHDLENGILRTPVDPLTTLADDPLRLLRGEPDPLRQSWVACKPGAPVEARATEANIVTTTNRGCMQMHETFSELRETKIRFACQLGFELEDDFKRAARDEQIHAALARKVSRERVGIEVKKIFTSKRVSMGLRLIEEFGIGGCVFSETSFQGMPGRVFAVEKILAEAEEVAADARLNSMVSAAFLKSSHHEVDRVIVEKLRWSRTLAKAALTILHRSGHLAPLVENGLPEDPNDLKYWFYKSKSDSWVPELALVRLETGAPHPLLKEMQAMVEQEQALTGVGMKPLLRGDVIARRLGGGRIVGIAIDQMIKWQLRNPRTQLKDAEEWLETFASQRRT
ncbi:hypothetical protein NDN08_001604 [Rhodosorus marinus]|uniref:Poly A polymerase head domain-containing protein n=1 Tax=Rhodosorus marinus TaxID=101924 RepID=A0AAV8UVF2_9RHOD|nr:hypothetical protein NDN08_001604 [Rhodosorus marinus]